MENRERYTINLAPGTPVAEVIIREGDAPRAQATLEELRDKVIDSELSKIREIAPDIAIIEI